MGFVGISGARSTGCGSTGGGVASIDRALAAVATFTPGGTSDLRISFEAPR